MRFTSIWVLTLGSIGVVFGDIGTSPLYSLQTALGRFNGAALRPADVIGVVSLVIWALLIVVTAKYVLFLMQADNKGEGGILSLKALAAYSSLSERMLRAFLRDPDRPLPHYRVGGRVLLGAPSPRTPGMRPWRRRA